MDNTIEYYNRNADEYFKRTFTAEMSPVYERFLKFLKPDSYICDLGCGSGRDSKYFMSKGYKVIPIDGSLEMCKLANKYINHKVICNRFDEIDYNNEFDGIWACASLLHVKKNELSKILKKIIQAAKNNAIIYTCFKIGNIKTRSDGRYFEYYTQEELRYYISRHEPLSLIEDWISNDVINPLEKPQWLNIIIKINK